MYLAAYVYRYLYVLLLFHDILLGIASPLSPWPSFSFLCVSIFTYPHFPQIVYYCEIIYKGLFETTFVTKDWQNEFRNIRRCNE